MSTTTTRPAFPEILVNLFPEHYGVHVSCLGEDGDIIALGHHDTRRAVAALNRYARRDLGLSDVFDSGRLFYMDVASSVESCWAVLMTECQYAHEDWHGLDEEPCWQCVEIKATVRKGGWWIRWDAAERDDGAFPVMVLTP